MHPQSTQLPLDLSTESVDPCVRVCESCGVLFRRRPSEFVNAQKRGYTIRFCSRSCRAQARTGRTFTCEVCESPFYRYQADIRKANAHGSRIRFCSKACERALKSSTNVQCTCEQCGKSFTAWASTFVHAEADGRGAGRFCSAPCRDAANGIRQTNFVMVPCTTCGKMHRRIPAKMVDRPFCSRKCMGAQVQTWTRYSHYGHGGIRPDIGVYMRSRWEANIARVLTAMGLQWEYEPKTFDCGDVFYTPDFLVSGDSWVEVKGYMTPIAQAKIDAFRSAHPQERLTLIERPMYMQIRREWIGRIPEWETGDI